MGVNILDFKLIGVLLAFMWIVLWMRFYINPKRLRKVLVLFDKKTLKFKIIGVLLVAFYILGVFVLFIKMMTH